VLSALARHIDNRSNKSDAFVVKTQGTVISKNLLGRVCLMPLCVVCRRPTPRDTFGQPVLTLFAENDTRLDGLTGSHQNRCEKTTVCLDGLCFMEWNN